MIKRNLIVTIFILCFIPFTFSSCDYNERVENSKNEEHIDYYEVTYVDGVKDTIKVWRIDGSGNGLYIKRKKIKYREPFDNENNFKTIYNTLVCWL